MHAEAPITVRSLVCYYQDAGAIAHLRFEDQDSCCEGPPSISPEGVAGPAAAAAPVPQGPAHAHSAQRQQQPQLRLVPC